MPLEIALTAALVVALVLVVLGRGAIFMRAAAAITLVLVLGDQSRLQPWVYEYVLLLVALSFGALNTCRSIIAALYFWSGVQKMNVTFLDRVWPVFAPSILAHAGWIVPVTEVVLALGLLFQRTRRAAVVALVATHAFVIAALAVRGENSVVWPWNATMAVLVVALFGRKEDFRMWSSQRAIQAAVWILPALSFFGLWDAYLSDALYAGNTIQGVFVIDPAIIPWLPPLIQRNTWQQRRPMFIDLNRWAYDELNVPAYPAERVMKEISVQICNTFIHRADQGMLVIQERPDWRTGVRGKETVPCTE